MPTDHFIISLFSGAMGLDLGIEAAGFKTAVALELNKQVVATIKKNKPDLPVIHKGIGGVPAKEILTKGRLGIRDACIVTGGPCCQSFSTVGKRGSISDKRGKLFRAFIRVVAATQPRFFVMENVKGILSAAVRHRPLNERSPKYAPLSRDEQLGSALKIILSELAKLNYYIVWGLLNCADYGVPQKRMRVVFIGSRDGEDITLPEKTHSETGADGLLPWVTLRQAIGDANDEHPEFIKFTDDRLKFLRMLKAGQHWTSLPKRLHKKALGAASKSWGGRCGFCRRLSWDKPAPTLVTSPTGRATTLCHPAKLRPLSVGEYATLQQFPAEWEFTGSVPQKYMQIGNAVPIGLGKAIGKMLKEAMARTLQEGLPKDAHIRLCQVCCQDKLLEARLKGRAKTLLHPRKLLDGVEVVEIQKWLAQAV